MISAALHRAVAQPLIYDAAQTMAGFHKVGRFLVPYLSEARGKTLLDVGAGTGNFRQFLTEPTRYIWFDCDPQKLAGFSAKRNGAMAALGDATRLCFGDNSIDYALCAAVSHHLTDDQLQNLFAELARVLTTKLVFFDAIDCPDRKISNLLWRYDRGSHPRSPVTLRQALEKSFDIELIRDLTIFHRYVLCIARPRK